MNKYTDFPDLKMTFLAVLFQTKWSSQLANKTNSFVVKEALSSFASFLEDDDVGYFFDPQLPNQFCNAGELVGKISNSNLPYNFNFTKAIDSLITVLEAIDEDDYNKIAVVVSDCLTEQDAKTLVKFISNVSNTKVVVFTIGKGCFKETEFIYLEDANDLSKNLNDVMHIWR